jgi:gluconolactonase
MNVGIVAADVGFTEGPVVTQAGEVIFTSIDRGCLYRLGPDGLEVMAITGGGPNGATEGASEAIYVAQNGGTRPAHHWPYVTGGVQVVRKGGKVDWLTQDPISPNDLCFGPDGLLYLTDPSRGRPARDDGRIWRCDAATGEAELLVSVPWYPNGLGFGLEDDAVYVASTGEHRIWRFPVNGDGLGRPEIFIEMEHGLPDGFAFDDGGNLILAAVGHDDHPGEIQTYDRNGRLIDTFHPGPHLKYTNVALSKSRILFITDADGGAVIAVDGWPTACLALHPLRYTSVGT